MVCEIAYSGSRAKYLLDLDKVHPGQAGYSRLQTNLRKAAVPLATVHTPEGLPLPRCHPAWADARLRAVAGPSSACRSVVKVSGPIQIDAAVINDSTII